MKVYIHSNINSMMGVVRSENLGLFRFYLYFYAALLSLEREKCITPIQSLCSSLLHILLSLTTAKNRKSVPHVSTYFSLFIHHSYIYFIFENWKKKSSVPYVSTYFSLFVHHLYIYFIFDHCKKITSSALHVSVLTLPLSLARNIILYVFVCHLCPSSLSILILRPSWNLHVRYLMNGINHHPSHATPFTAPCSCLLITSTPIHQLSASTYHQHSPSLLIATYNPSITIHCKHIRWNDGYMY